MSNPSAELPMRKFGSSLDLEELSKSTSLEDLTSPGTSSQVTKQKQRRRWLIPVGICLTFLLIIIILVVVLVTTQSGQKSLSNWISGPPTAPSKCTFERTKETVTYATHIPLHLKNGVILDGIGNVKNNVDLIVENGKITYLGEPKDPQPNAEVIDLKGNYVTPGLVDLHSHLGVYSLPEMRATQDGNEITNPAFPQVFVNLNLN